MVKRKLTGSIKSNEEHERVIRQLLRGPIVLGMLCYLLASEALFEAGFNYEAGSVWARIVVLIFFTAFTWSVFYRFLPKWIYISAIRNIAIIWPCLASLFILLLIKKAGLLAIFSREFTGTMVVVALAEVSILTILACVVTIASVKNYYVRLLAVDGRTYPIWRGVAKITSELTSFIPPEIQGKVLKMQSHNQYLEVTTDKGSAEIRMALKDAIEKLSSADSGTRVHRSYWIRNSRIKDIFYQNGNPFIETIDDSRIPVSRTALTKLKEILAKLE